MLVFIKRFSPSICITNARILTCFNRCCSNALPSIGKSDESTGFREPSGNGDVNSANHRRGTYNSPLLWGDQPQLDSCQIEVVDSDTWRVSSLARVSSGVEHESELSLFGLEVVGDGISNNPQHVEDDNDFDEIEDMRIHGNLFYKIDRGSKEFEEYAFDFHRRKSSSSNKNDKREKNSKENSSCDSIPKVQKPLKGKEGLQECNKKGYLRDDSFVNEERLVRTIKEKYIVCTPNEIDNSLVQKRQRTLTFNQLTGPYHEPFCLDIYVSKGSVRACVVHRVTSKVVAVAHSISKDMKFDLGSSVKSTTAAAAVGKVLAQRAMEDDIYDVVFTPRKGDKLEGKLQIVLRSIIDNGVNVKVKLKQRNPNKPIKRAFD